MFGPSNGGNLTHYQEVLGGANVTQHSGPSGSRINVYIPGRYSGQIPGNAATRANLGHDEPAQKKAVVFEVDPAGLDQTLLYPDEDYVAHLMYERDLREPTAKQKTHIHANLEVFRHLWTKSIAELGNCAYQGTIPPQAITRYCLFDTAARPELTLHVRNSLISLMNYAMYGRHNQQIAAWCFGDQKNLPMVVGSTSDEERQFWLAQSTDRTGIEVVTLKRTRS